MPGTRTGFSIKLIRIGTLPGRSFTIPCQGSTVPPKNQTHETRAGLVNLRSKTEGPNYCVTSVSGVREAIMRLNSYVTYLNNGPEHAAS